MLDTSVLIASPRLAAEQNYGASMIALGELQFGIRVESEASVRAGRIERLARLRTALQWITFDENAAESYGILAAAVVKARPAHAQSKDILMAAQAHSLGVPFMTRNVKAFTLVNHLVEILEY